MRRSAVFAALLRPALLVAAATLAAPVPGHAQALPLDDAIARHTPAITRLRHDLHQNPELSNRETETAALVARHLRATGMEVRTGIAKTGVVGVLRGGRPGPVVAVRFDMDALPVTEATGLPFASTKRATFGGQEVGVMHACGHDIHVAVGLGLASVLAERQATIPGTVLFIFQPAEEGPPAGEAGGAPLMLEEGVFRNPRPEAVFALHTMPDYEVGQLAYTPGPAMAAADTWRAVIRGKQSHGARPEDSVDPIVMAAQAVMALQTIRSRNIPATAPGVVTVGVLHGGQRHNIIPAEVRLEGTVRTFDPAIQDMVERRMNEILDGITKAGGGACEMTYERGVPVVVNDLALADRVAPSLARAVGADNVHIMPAVTTAEDFSYFANEVPGFYFRLGTTRPGTTSGGLHTPTYLGDDAAIPVGIEAMATIVLDYLSAPSTP